MAFTFNKPASSGAASTGGFGFGAAASKPAATGGFGGFGASTGAATGGGFGGFGAAASTGGGFGGFGAATGGGFGGFGAASAAASTGGFGGFGAKPATGGFGGFGGGFGAKAATSGFGATTAAGFGMPAAATMQAAAMMMQHSAVPFDFQKQLQELGKDSKGNRDVEGEKLVALHVELEHHIAGQDGTGGMRAFAGSNGMVRKPRIGTIDRGIAEERQLLAKVDEQLRHHVHDVTKLEGFLSSSQSAYESFFETLSQDLQMHQSLLRKVEVENAHAERAAPGNGGASEANALGMHTRDGLSGSLALAEVEPPEVAMARSLEHLNAVCWRHEQKITELSEQVQRVEEHLRTRDTVAAQSSGDGEAFNPLALKDAMKMQYDTFLAAAHEIAQLHSEVETMKQLFAADNGFALGGDGDMFAQGDRDYYEHKNRFKKAEQMERRRIEIERDQQRWNEHRQAVLQGNAAAPAALPAAFAGTGAASAATPAFGSFGATSAATSAPAFGGFGGFGAKTGAASAAAGGFGGFGAKTGAAAAGGFGGFGAKTGAASAAAGGFGGFGAKTGAAPAAAGGFGGFGAKTGAGSAAAGGFSASSGAGFGGFGAAASGAATAGTTLFGGAAAGAPAPPAFGGFGGANVPTLSAPPKNKKKSGKH